MTLRVRFPAGTAGVHGRFKDQKSYEVYDTHLNLAQGITFLYLCDEDGELKWVADTAVRGR